MLADLVFECHRCGCCCNRILIPYRGITVGLSLLPGEEHLFESCPGAVKPYMGLRRMRGKGYNVEVVCYQMVQQPCPLYDRILNRCTRYEDRPMVCREYPFSNDPSSSTVEQHCTWVKSNESLFDKTPIQMEPGQQSAIIRINSFFLSLHDLMVRERSMLVMLDSATDEWAIIKAGDEMS